jgi:PAS domain-containing protein
MDKRREADAALRKSEERLRVLPDAAFEGVAIIEAGRISETNAASMFGYEPRELFGMGVLELVTPVRGRPCAPTSPPASRSATRPWYARKTARPSRRRSGAAAPPTGATPSA